VLGTQLMTERLCSL